MELFRKENTESKNSQLWLGWLDLNQRMSVSKTDTLTTWRHPHYGTPHRIRTDTLQILNLLPATDWASGALGWLYCCCPILTNSVSKSIHRAMGKLQMVGFEPTYSSGRGATAKLSYICMSLSGFAACTRRVERRGARTPTFLHLTGYYRSPSCCHTIAVAAASFLLFEKPSRNPPNPTGFMAAGLGFEPKDGASPSPVFKTGALNQALPSRHNLKLVDSAGFCVAQALHSLCLPLEPPIYANQLHSFRRWL